VPRTAPTKIKDKSKYITMNEVEPIYGIGRTKLYYLMKEGKIRAVKLGNRESKRTRVLVDVESLEAYLEGLPNHVLPSFKTK
jgi:predicted DNA-binding transcriptional regulator AlpA